MKWWAGTNDESYEHGPLDTREEAIEALDGYGGYICQAEIKPLRLSKWVRLDQLLEMGDDEFFDSDRCGEADEESPFQVSPKLEADLISRIEATIDQWQEEHELKFVPRTFSNQTDPERIEADATTD